MIFLQKIIDNTEEWVYNYTNKKIERFKYIMTFSFNTLSIIYIISIIIINYACLCMPMFSVKNKVSGIF